MCKPINSNKRWSQEDDQLLIRGFHKYKYDSVVADRSHVHLNRTYGAVLQRLSLLRHLGIIPKINEPISYNPNTQDNYKTSPVVESIPLSENYMVNVLFAAFSNLSPEHQQLFMTKLVTNLHFVKVA